MFQNRFLFFVDFENEYKTETKQIYRLDFRRFFGPVRATPQNGGR